MLLYVGTDIATILTDIYLFDGCRLYLPVVFARLLPASQPGKEAAITQKI